MATFTTFLELTLPELNEFVNTWHQPVNQNMELIDDFLDDLHESLVGTSATSTWADLRGTLGSLAARLDVSIAADGTLNISGSDEILNMATSAVTGAFSDPSARLDDGDFEVFDARQPVVGSRFSPIPGVGPTAGFPPEKLDSGIALRTADFGATADKPISGPHVPWAAGLMTGGANPLIAGIGIGQVRISADTSPAVFNVDGYIFRLREIIDFDWNMINGGGAPSNNQYVWMFVDRNEGGYNNANYRYNAPGGSGFAAKDLRKLQAGTANGTTSVSTFTCAAALFNTAAFAKVKSGDTLVITSGAAAGSYVINALDGTTPDTKLTIKGKFKAATTGISWYVRDTAMPNIGAVVTDTTTTTLPPYVAGRVYFARARHNTGGNPTAIVTFTAGGVFDSGWVAVDAGADFPYTVTHDLGRLPSDVQVWFRVNATGRIYRGVVKRQLVTNVDEGNTTLDPGDTKKVDLLLPSHFIDSDEIDVVVNILNASTDPSKPVALFTDSGGTDQAVGEMRVIARR